MKKFIFSAAIFAIGLVLTAVCFGYFYKEARVVVTDQIKNIRVKGYAVKNISSDKAIWTGTIVTQGNSLQEAYRQLEQQRKQVQKFLAEKNLPAKEISFSTINTQPQQELNQNSYPTNNITGYMLHQDVRIESSDTDKVVAISTESSDLIREGINFQSQQPQFFNSEIES